MAESIMPNLILTIKDTLNLRVMLNFDEVVAIEEILGGGAKIHMKNHNPFRINVKENLDQINNMLNAKEIK